MSNFKQEVNELKELLGAKTDAQLAERMGVAVPTISTWKQRGLSGDAKLALFTARKEKITQNESEADKPLHVNTITATKLSPIVSAGNGSNVECIDSVDKIGQLVLDVTMFKTTPPKNLYAMQVDGYSMVPMIFPDSWVVFEEVGDFRGDGLYIVNWRNVLMVKLLQVNSAGNLRIVSVNKEYESYEVSPDDQSVFRIMGKVIRTII